MHRVNRSAASFPPRLPVFSIVKVTETTVAGSAPSAVMVGEPYLIGRKKQYLAGTVGTHRQRETRGRFYDSADSIVSESLKVLNGESGKM